MNVADNIWNKLTRVVVFLLLLAGLVGLFAWYRPLIEENARLRKRIEQLNDKVKMEITTKRQHEAAIAALQDPKAVERLIRNQLLYARTNETVVRFEDPVTHSAPAR